MLHNNTLLMSMIVFGAGIFLSTVQNHRETNFVVGQERGMVSVAKKVNSKLGSTDSMVLPGFENFPDYSKEQGLHICAALHACLMKLDLAQNSGGLSESPPSFNMESLEINKPTLFPRLGLTRKAGRHAMPDLLPTGEEYSFAWFNPFQIDLAMAQSPFSISLSMPTYWSTDPVASGILTSGDMFNGTYILKYSMHSNFDGTEKKPYIALTFTAQASGWYLIDFYGQKAKAKLRHLDAGPIVATWDMHNAAGGPNVHYITPEYLEAGLHRFYFWVVKHNGAPSYSPGTAILGITVDSI